MTARKLFVSHSSKTPENLALLKEICARLGPSGEGFHVLVDQGGEIPAGADWELRLNEWLAECHAAVILFTEAALCDSDWVKKEAAILSWRREIEDGFKVIPVLLDGLTPEELTKGLFGVLRIDKSQCIRCGSTTEAICCEIAKGLGTVPEHETPFDRLEKVIVRILVKNADAETLEDAWEHLDFEHKPPWRPDRGERFAAALTRALLRDGLSALGKLEKLLNEIRPLIPKGRAKELLGYVGNLWVQAEAAGGISAAHQGERLVALNGDYFDDFTGQCYLERAWPLTNHWKLARIHRDSRSRSRILEDIRAEFRPSPRVPDAAVDRWINNSCDGPVLVFLPQPDDPGQLPDKQLLSELRTHYPKAVFVVPTGPDTPNDIEAYTGAKPLLPLLDPQVEEQQFFAFNSTNGFIDTLPGPD